MSTDDCRAVVLYWNYVDMNLYSDYKHLRLGAYIFACRQETTLKLTSFANAGELFWWFFCLDQRLNHDGLFHKGYNYKVKSSS